MTRKWKFWISPFRGKKGTMTEAEAKEAEQEESEREDEDFEPFVCRKCGKIVTSPSYEVCEGK